MNPDEYEKMFRLEDTHWWFAGKRRLVRVILDSLPSNSDRLILDVGCGTGGMFSLLENYGRLVGIDESELAMALAAKRQISDLARAALPKLPFVDSSFGFVGAFDVLYHRRVEDDLAALKEIARVLKPRGNLVITDSAIEFLRSAHDEALQGARRYTTREMHEKLIAAGFAVKRISYANLLIFPAAALWRLFRRGVSTEKGSDVRPAPAWINNFLGYLYLIEAGLFRRIDFPIGTSIIALAEKI
jgi:SAM-dependent methyltransferase